MYLKPGRKITYRDHSCAPYEWMCYGRVVAFDPLPVLYARDTETRFEFFWGDVEQVLDTEIRSCGDTEYLVAWLSYRAWVIWRKVVQMRGRFGLWTRKTW